MKVCVAQTKPVTVNIFQNIENHKAFVNNASTNGADIIIFPELSLTGYEPSLAKELAVDPKTSQLDIFQEISDVKKIIIGAGIPTISERGICISMILFQPGQERLVYSKKYLHSDEEPFFVKGENIPFLQVKGSKVAIAVCYEISVQQHANDAFKERPDVYVASVAKFKNGIDKAVSRLSEIASMYSTPVLMSNCIGISDGLECAGKTSVLNSKGALTEQLDELNEGFLILDTETSQVYSNYISINSKINTQFIKK